MTGLRQPAEQSLQQSGCARPRHRGHGRLDSFCCWNCPHWAPRGVAGETRFRNTMIIVWGALRSRSPWGSGTLPR